MAQFNGNPWDDLAEQLKAAEARTPRIMDEAIKRAARCYVVETQKTMQRMNVRDTGALSGAVKPGPMLRIVDGRMIEVWPQGTRYDKKHKNGERNETIAFVTIHGRPGKFAGRNYIQAAEKDAEPRALEEISNMLGEALNGG